MSWSPVAPITCCRTSPTPANSSPSGAGFDMQRIPRDRARKFAFDWRDEPLLTIRPNEAVEGENWDASTGYFKAADDKAIPGKRPGFARSPPLVNPIAGPVYVEGADRGDSLAITLESIPPEPNP